MFYLFLFSIILLKVCFAVAPSVSFCFESSEIDWYIEIIYFERKRTFYLLSEFGILNSTFGNHSEWIRPRDRKRKIPYVFYFTCFTSNWRSNVKRLWNLETVCFLTYLSYKEALLPVAYLKPAAWALCLIMQRLCEARSEIEIIEKLKNEATFEMYFQ